MVIACIRRCCCCCFCIFVVVALPLDRSCWWALGQRLLRWPVNAGTILLFVGLSLGFDIYALKFTSSDDISLWMPTGSGKLWGSRETLALLFLAK